ncbi:Ubiquitin family protein [Trichomonas vaginalis G3]|uniref:Ubiquitin family protein n=1 Tax=Trichomonas vaginalis (strain ATCC PRA-98 / G3) TaxID=412133 RepID=A2EJ37_TRIV3|nr:cellular macromolecule catabolic process [Trichomonas vaginalis G3]EAY07340.1 Ubiquitin family protein [Trichomonas vaginalis G3]KAI5524513.1 cellular macromolecule catabolic process [Trichomonas vaginalis G3]|eukprot:XP_001319563.1 Ubiquitin family protein [Trichomonas vaginalis G3]
MDLNLEDIGQNIERYIDDDKFLSSLKANQICKILDNSRLTSSQYSTLFFNLSKYFGKVDMLIILSHAHTDIFQTRNDARLVSDTISSVLGINTLNNLFSFYDDTSDNNQIDITVRTSDYLGHVIKISPESTVSDLKNIIQEDLSIDSNIQQLYLERTLLKDNQKIKDLRFNQDSFIEVTEDHSHPSNRCSCREGSSNNEEDENINEEEEENDDDDDGEEEEENTKN